MWCRNVFVLLVSSVLLLEGQQQQQQNYVTVNCSQGPVQGRQVNLGNDQSQLYSGQANAYTGIPYCQAPVGNLRFQPPQPLNTFNTTLHDATSYRPKCPQQNAGAPTNEDCLYLNVYTPQSGTNLSVLVLIDGSNGFTQGGCDQNQEKGIVSNLVQRQIVVVTLQYRIGALGFFTTYTSTVQSNLGMLDQVQAMQWIKSEIVNFGGNPNQITVAGQDDGACAVSAHTLSPMSQNLFNQAIVQSGSIYSCYNPTPAVPTNPTVQTTTPRPMYDQPNVGYGNAGYQNNFGYQPQSTTPQSSYNSANAQYDDPNQQLAATLCNISPTQWNDGQTQNLQNCLKNYTVDFFVNQQPGGPTATWMIVRDTSFLPGSIDSLSGKRPNIPIIIGTVQDEDADYAFKLINTGNGNDPNNLDNWIFDFAKKNKLNQTQTNQVSNIISNNYGVTTGQTNNQYQAGQGQQTNNQYSNGGQQINNQYQGSNQNSQQYNQNSQQYNQNSQQYNQNSQQYNQNSQQNNQNSQQYNQNSQQYNQNSQQNNQNSQQNNQNSQQYNQNQQTNNQYQGQQYTQGSTQQYYGGVVAGQTTYSNQGQQYNQGSTQNQYNNQQQGSYASNGQQYSNQNNQQYSNQNSQQNSYSNQQYSNQQNNQQYSNQNSQQTYNNQQQQYNSNQNSQQNYGGSTYSNQQYNNNQNSGMSTNGNNYNGGYLRDQPTSVQTQNGVTDYSQLRTITQIASDQSTSLTTTQIQSYMQNGSRHVRIYQFTHVSEVGRNTVPDTGANWKPVFKGQDMYFITMSETIWTNSNYTAQDRQVANQMGQRWTDFVKTGQVANWDTTNQQNYNYCNLNTQPTQQANYAPQARQVFQDQVNPICQVAQNNYAQANNQSLPYPSTTSSSSIQRNPGTAQAQYTNTANGGSNFHITFQVNSLPFNGK